MRIRGIFEDPISGLLLCGGVIFGLTGAQFKPGTAFEMIGLTIQAIALGLFILRIIRLWNNQAYMPSARALPWLKLLYAVSWVTFTLLLWPSVNMTDNPFVILIEVIFIIFAVREVYGAIKIFGKHYDRH